MRIRSYETSAKGSGLFVALENKDALTTLTDPPSLRRMSRSWGRRRRRAASSNHWFGLEKAFLCDRDFQLKARKVSGEAAK